MDHALIAANLGSSLFGGGIVLIVARSILSHATSTYLAKIEGAASKADVEKLLKECVTKQELEVAKLLIERQIIKELSQTRHDIRNEMASKLDALQSSIGRIEGSINTVMHMDHEADKKLDNYA